MAHAVEGLPETSTQAKSETLTLTLDTCTQMQAVIIL